MTSDTLSNISILVALLALAFNFVLPQVDKILAIRVSVRETHEMRTNKEKISDVCWRKCFPLLIGLFLLTYVNVPTFIEIIITSELAIWNFDVGLTLYVLLVFSLFALLIGVALKWVQVFKHLRKFSKKVKSNN
ncbi:hypothetical protein J6J08_05955 [Pseudidiomarina sp. 1APR75-33.1]|uniref:hypothetical protein n=1 Tax=Pseudidiomarina terrestris TaxID=2820060 RepID=UPI00264D373D|nr:hypothetical protein [Pseudidiomarina sp. 1APR75-33.1]MDN7126918.1 hypothetical protein [Pseudidiomarina sp. 1APR75-33.1]